MDKRGTWSKSAFSLLSAAILALGIRWCLFEAYVIPSGSMLPTLLIQDHIFVNKLVYGVRYPFSKHWILMFRHPHRGEVIVFRWPVDEGTFFIKRVIGEPGDVIDWNGRQLTVNGNAVDTSPNPHRDSLLASLTGKDMRDAKSDYDAFEENLNGHLHTTLIDRDAPHEQVNHLVVPADSLFVMGDNRDNSSDSRYWGMVPIENVLGRAMFVWLSCRDTLKAPLDFVCNPATIRWARFFHPVR